MKVLLLEPYTGMRVMMRGVIRALGVETLHEPRTSIEAMHILLHDKIDLFLCSDKVKPLDAILCIKLIRAARESHIRHIRTIVSIDDYEAEDIKAVIDAGCDEVLQKPFSADDISARFHRLIRNRAAFIECKAYVGPDRRKWQAPLKQDDMRDDKHNPGQAVFNHSLTRLIQRLFDLQAERKEKKRNERLEELKARGVYTDDQFEERDVSLERLKEGMVLSKPVESESGMLVLPSGSSLNQKNINRLIDLVKCGRVEDIFSIVHNTEGSLE